MGWRIAIVVVVAACAHRGRAEVRNQAAEAEADLGPWHCTAYVSRVTTDERIDVEGHGQTIEEAYADAWTKACEAFPETDPPTPCAFESPRMGWTWTREDLEGVVTLHLLPDPAPYQGVAESTVSRTDACDTAYVRACEAAGAQAGCQTDPAFVDEGIGAVSDD